ncbi:MAG: hypothetical protein GXY83_01110, partial [Rhodopirellula sp.]|nr:hypothetical protein [Rhodopirellula sp.]
MIQAPIRYSIKFEVGKPVSFDFSLRFRYSQRAPNAEATIVPATVVTARAFFGQVRRFVSADGGTGSTAAVGGT